MKTITLLTTLLSVNLVVGARWTQQRRESREANAWSFPDGYLPENVARSENDNQGSPRKSSSRPFRPVQGFSGLQSRNNESHTIYSQNWAGALLVGTGYTAVTGTITVPSPTGANAATQSAGAAVSPANSLSAIFFNICCVIYSRL